MHIMHNMQKIVRHANVFAQNNTGFALNTNVLASNTIVFVTNITMVQNGTRYKIFQNRPKLYKIVQNLPK